VRVSAYIILLASRVSLARAVYARTKYVLLDDPLSAVVNIPLILLFTTADPNYSSRTAILLASSLTGYSVGPC
jgi:ABC-type dipeptide/oligopeptide/nickel transport system ATPase subunit